MAVAIMGQAERHGGRGRNRQIKKNKKKHHREKRKKVRDSKSLPTLTVDATFNHSLTISVILACELMNINSPKAGSLLYI